MIVATIATHAILWFPYIFSEQQTWKLVLQRLFPVHRGLYEDKVANLWCFVNNFLKTRSLLNQRTLVLISALLTLLGALPSVIMIFKAPNRKTFIMATFNCSMSFFLCSYMVHEKSILLPLLPFALMFFTYKHFYTSTMMMALFSNFFLLRRDGCTIPYYAIMILVGFISYTYEEHYINTFNTGIGKNVGPAGKLIGLIQSMHKMIRVGSVLFIVVFHLLEYFIIPPKKLPDLFLVINVNISFILFGFVWIYSNLLLYVHASSSEPNDTDLISENKTKSKKT